ncbi:pre-rRNA-processing protein IPI3 [Fomitiporia mediterranea MF3/22]|uniref:pre-rRNA-processing protein IPI3 n=1 Tax=Fomitiporia mediterranea (strain MF3/22) TaxID=694068 RepID=UPI00044086F9|nr:pre-rRNA-processing protein IPI3 [Fomitiporia mediterranea MF3/22]EJD07635.1 pre-rRNA-processing protein IPI3 [Fomitiporia mediterranea MF3/22]
MRYQETILCSSGASSSSQGLGAVTVHDFNTGSLLVSFKQTCSEPHSTSILQTKNGQGGFILAAQPDKSILNAYYFQKDQIALKMVLPEKLSCIAIDKAGDYCAGGTAQGRIYLWEASQFPVRIASGILVNVWDAHYRKVTVLRFTRDCAALISGSEDSGISVWSISSLLCNESQHETPTPYCNLSDHTLPITDIVCGVGSFPACRLLTSSIDHSVKLWDLSSRTLLTTFLFPSPIHSLAFETAERTFFAASSEGTGPDAGGTVYQVKLFRRRDPENNGHGVEALGGGGVGEAIRLDADPKRVIFVGQPISTLALSLTRSTLLVGTTTGEVNLYDIASHQLLRTISPVKDKGQGLSITHIECMLKPPDLIGHISLGLNVGGITSVKDVMPTRPIAPFQRVRDSKAREAHEVPIILPSQNEPYVDPTIYTTEELLRDQAVFLQSHILPDANGGTQNSLLAQQTRLAELESEVQRLRTQLTKAKNVNDAMWEAVAQRIVSDKKGSIATLPVNGS